VSVKGSLWTRPWHLIDIRINSTVRYTCVTKIPNKSIGLVSEVTEKPKTGKCRARIKAGFLYFSPNFSTQKNVSYYNANPTKPNTLGTS